MIDNLITIKYIKPNCCAFKIVDSNFELDQHFPTKAIIPAFLQLSWLQSILITHYKVKTIDGYHDVKFISPVTPGSEMELHLELKSQSKESSEFLSFIFSSKSKTISKGRIKVKF